MKKEDISYQKEIFEAQRKWLTEEYKKAKDSKPRNDAKVYELENRIKAYGREIKKFQKTKKELGIN